MLVRFEEWLVHRLMDELSEYRHHSYRSKLRSKKALRRFKIALYEALSEVELFGNPKKFAGEIATDVVERLIVTGLLDSGSQESCENLLIETIDGYRHGALKQEYEKMCADAIKNLPPNALI